MSGITASLLAVAMAGVIPFSANVLCGSNTAPVCTWTNAGVAVL